MNEAYVIQWKNKVNGRAGRGTRQLSREEADELAQELNQEYPEILHEAVPWRDSPPVPAESSAKATPTQARVITRGQEEQEEEDEEKEESSASQSLPA